MIVPGTRIYLAEVPVERIVISECQPRYPDRVNHYFNLLSDPRHADSFAGLVHLAPYGVNTLTGKQQYTLLDGHHRYLASVIAGRRTVLALIFVELDWPEYAERQAGQFMGEVA